MALNTAGLKGIKGSSGGGGGWFPVPGGLRRDNYQAHCIGVTQYDGEWPSGKPVQFYARAAAGEDPEIVAGVAFRFAFRPADPEQHVDPPSDLSPINDPSNPPVFSELLTIPADASELPDRYAETIEQTQQRLAAYLNILNGNQVSDAIDDPDAAIENVLAISEAQPVPVVLNLDNRYYKSRKTGHDVPSENVYPVAPGDA